MLDELKLKDFLEERGVVVSGRIAKDTFENNRFFVFVVVERNSDNRQVPSNKILNDLKYQVNELGAEVEFVLTDAKQADIEAGYRASMLHSHGHYVRNAFLSLEGPNVVAWIAPKSEIPKEVLAEIERRTQLYLSLQDLKLVRIDFTSAANVPTRLACLKVARIISPFSADDLTQALRLKGFVVPSENWMVRTLDGLRKAGHVIWQKSGRYVVTLAGLKALGTQKNGQSPDVKRVLALARARD